MQSPASVYSMIHRLEQKNNRKSKAERIKAYMLEVGQIVEGKVTGLTGFGAFVALPDGKSGMVHISEVSNVSFSILAASTCFERSAISLLLLAACA